MRTKHVQIMDSPQYQTFRELLSQQRALQNRLWASRETWRQLAPDELRWTLEHATQDLEKFSPHHAGRGRKGATALPSIGSKQPTYQKVATMATKHRSAIPVLACHQGRSKDMNTPLQTDIGLEECRDSSWLIGQDMAPQRWTSTTRICSSSSGALEVSCLIITKIGFPPLQWLFLHSLRLEPFSLMDQRILNLVPTIAGTIEQLQTRPQVCMLSVLSISTMTVLALSIPILRSHYDSTSGNLIHHRELLGLIALVFAVLYWAYESGSPLDFFLIGMPLAFSVGISLGILCQSLRSLSCIRHQCTRA